MLPLDFLAKSSRALNHDTIQKLFGDAGRFPAGCDLSGFRFLPDRLLKIFKPKILFFQIIADPLHIRPKIQIIPKIIGHGKPGLHASMDQQRRYIPFGAFRISGPGAPGGYLFYCLTAIPLFRCRITQPERFGKQQSRFLHKIDQGIVDGGGGKDQHLSANVFSGLKPQEIPQDDRPPGGNRTEIMGFIDNDQI